MLRSGEWASVSHNSLAACEQGLFSTVVTLPGRKIWAARGQDKEKALSSSHKCPILASGGKDCPQEYLFCKMLGSKGIGQSRSFVRFIPQKSNTISVWGHSPSMKVVDSSIINIP